MTPKKSFLLVFALLTLTSTRAWPFSYHIKNFGQAGFEYDSNTFKNYNVSEADGVFRALFKTASKLEWATTNLGVSYRLGGKKYFTRPQQDMLINYVEVDLNQKLSSKVTLTANSILKHQAENGDVDADNFDINEDFIQFEQSLGFRFNPKKGFYFKPVGEFLLFDFNKDYPSLDYYRQKYGMSVFKGLSKSLEFGFVYSYSRYHFTKIERTDGLNEFACILKYAKGIFASLSYTFQTNDSNQGALSFTNNKVSIIASVPIRFRRHDKSSTNLDPDLALSLIGILQFKNYPSQTMVDSEGQRFLLSESEEDNFNIIILKVTKSLGRRFAAEFKYTRHSNEFASTGESYRRATYYLGGRLSF